MADEKPVRAGLPRIHHGCTAREVLIPRKDTTPFSSYVPPVLGSPGMLGATLSASDWHEIAATIGIDARAFDEASRERIEDAIFWYRHTLQCPPRPTADVVRAVKQLGNGADPGTGEAARIARIIFRTAENGEGADSHEIARRVIATRRPPKRTSKPFDHASRALIRKLQKEFEHGTAGRITARGHGRNINGKPNGRFYRFVSYVFRQIARAEGVRPASGEALAALISTRESRARK